MKISYNLLKEFLPQLNIKPEDLAEEISLKLAEVDSVNKAEQDYILEIENKALTHRPDCFSHWGIAREIATYFKLELKNPHGLGSDPQRGSDPLFLQHLAINLITPSCHRYIGAIIKVKVKESPDWLKIFLQSMELRPVNNVVDLTNYVMLKYGQPIHAFSMTPRKSNSELAEGAAFSDGGINPPKLHAKADDSYKIIVRQARNDEKITTIDHQERILDESMMIIADSQNPIAIAGIMGGKETEVSGTTKEIVLESANFEMYSIRKTSSKLGLRSDASTQFEKGQDPNLAQIGFEQTVNLLEQYAEARIISEVIDVYPHPKEQTKIEFNPQRVESFLGIKLTYRLISTYLESLHLEIDYQGKSAHKPWRISIPTYRSDLKIEEDLLEEIARLHGYNKIKGTVPQRDLTPSPHNQKIQIRRRTKRALRALGFDEIYNYSFTNKQSIKNALLSPNRYIKLSNPLSVDHTHLRQWLIPGLLEKARENLKYLSSFSLFELGKHIKPQKQAPLPLEIEHVALIEAAEDVVPIQNIYLSLKGKVQWLLRELNITDVLFEPSNKVSFLDISYQTELIDQNGTTFGHLGLISTKVKQNFEIHNKQIAAAEINFEHLLIIQKDHQEYLLLSPHPEIKQDLSFIVDKNTNLGLIVKAIKETGKDLLQIAEVFDIFHDPSFMKDNEKSVAVRLIFQSSSHSLSHQEVTKLVEKIAKMIESDFQGKIRR